MGFNPGEIASLGFGLVGGKLFGRSQANKRLKELEKLDPAYTVNPEAAARLVLAKTLLNGRSPGAMAVEKNIYANQANQTAFAQKTATDASQLLATGGEIQGRTNQAFENLGLNEIGDWQRKYSNMVGAQEGVINEGDKVFNDQVRRFNDHAGIQGAITENSNNAWSDIANLAFSLANFGLGGGFSNMFGSGAAGGKSGYSGNWILPGQTPGSRMNYTQ